MDDVAAIEAVVVAFRSAGLIEECLDALEANTAVHRVVVVEQSGETHAPRGPAVEFVARPNRGFGAGVNEGLRLTDAPFVLVVNPDAVVTDAVARALPMFDAAEVGAVQGVVLGRETGLPERSSGVLMRPMHLWGRALGGRRLLEVPLARSVARRLQLLRDHADRIPARVAEVEWLAATAVLYRRAALVDVDGFDEGYFLYGEDLDLAVRLRRAGWRLLALPDTWAVHRSGASSPSTLERELHWWAGTVRYAAQWWSAPAWLAAVAASAVAALRLLSADGARIREIVDMLVATPVRERSSLVERRRRRPGSDGR